MGGGGGGGGGGKSILAWQAALVRGLIYCYIKNPEKRKSLHSLLPFLASAKVSYNSATPPTSANQSRFSITIISSTSLLRRIPSASHLAPRIFLLARSRPPILDAGASPLP
jgi:hypothetical protein